MVEITKSMVNAITDKRKPSLVREIERYSAEDIIWNRDESNVQTSNSEGEVVLYSDHASLISQQAKEIATVKAANEVLARQVIDAIAAEKRVKELLDQANDWSMLADKYARSIDKANARAEAAERERDQLREDRHTIILMKAAIEADRNALREQLATARDDALEEAINELCDRIREIGERVPFSFVANILRAMKGNGHE